MMTTIMAMAMPPDHDHGMRFLAAAMRLASDNTDGASDTAAEDEDDDNDKYAVVDSVIVRTMRVYGSFYAVCFVLFEILRRLYPRLYSIRAWCPSLKCQLAQENYSGGDGSDSSDSSGSDPGGRRFIFTSLFSWFWKVFYVHDESIFEQCGMDALCFIRALRFCRKLGIFGCLNAIWLIPVYATAPDSPETAHLTSPLEVISIGNLPNQSLRFMSTIVAAYTMYFYTMYLLLQEFEWFTRWRHKFLSRRVPRSYAVYVYGIPKEYQSSYKLANYFRSCTTTAASQLQSSSGVLEAHVAMDIPKIEKLQTERDRVVARLERVMVVEQKTGSRHMHRRWTKNSSQQSSFGNSGLGGGNNNNNNSSSNSVGSAMIGPGRLEMVESISQYESELERLNREIPRRIHEVMLVNDPMRSRLNRMAHSTNLVGVMEFSSSSSSSSSSSNIEHDDDEQEGKDGTNSDDDDEDEDDLEMQANVMLPMIPSSTNDGDSEESEFCTDSPHERRRQSPETVKETMETMEPIVPVASHENVYYEDSPDTQSQSEDDVLPLEVPHCRRLRHSKQGFDLSDQDRAILSILVPEHSALFKTNHDQSTTTTSLFRTGDHAHESSALSSFGPQEQLPAPLAAEDNSDVVPSHRQQSDRAIRQLIIDVPTKSDEDSVNNSCNDDQDDIDNDNDDQDNEPTEDPIMDSGTNNHKESTSTYPLVTADGHEKDAAGPPRRGDLSSIRADNHDPTSLSGKTLASRATNVTVESSVSSSRQQRVVNTSKTALAGSIVKSTQMAKKTFSKTTRVAGKTITKGTRVAGETLTKGTRVAGETLTKGTKVAGDTIVLGSRVATVATKRAGQSIAAGATAATETLIKATADGGQMTVSAAKEIGGHIVKSAVTMVPIVISAGRGDPRSAGFVVFANLYAAQAALQMSHHPK
jgi:Late exocytosis, associated with Golgi transport/Cytosolic domain of 10TM putative phosphate transporter